MKKILFLILLAAVVLLILGNTTALAWTPECDDMNGPGDFWRCIMSMADWLFEEMGTDQMDDWFHEH